MPDQAFDWLGKALERLGLGPGWSLAIVGFLLTVAFLVRRNIKILEDCREPTAPGLEHERRIAAQERLRAGESYRAALGHMLDWLDARLGKSAFSAEAFRWCFKLAVVYPILGVLLVWVVSGENTSGIQSMLADQVAPARRVVLIILMSILFLAFLNLRASSGRIFYLSFVFLIAMAAAIGTLAEFSVVLSAATVGIGAVLASGSLGGIAGVTSALAFSVFGFGLAGAAVVVVVGVFTYGCLHIDRRSGVLIGSGVQFFVFILSLALVARFSAGLGFNDRSRALLIFLVALPLVNLLFDWVSLGITRDLLRGTMRGGSALINGVIDLLAAILILVCLAIATTGALQGLNLLAAYGGAQQPLIDVAGVLTTLRARPGDWSVAWVYIMLFSTLLPSFAHAVIAAGHVVTLATPGWLRNRHLLHLEGGFVGDRRKLLAAARHMTIVDVLALSIAAGSVTAVSGVLIAFHIGLPWLANFLLWTAELVAYGLGAPVQLHPPW